MRTGNHIQSASRLVAAAILWSGISACAAPPPAPAPTSSTDDVTLIVRNNNWLDAKIYLLTGAAKRRVGTVSSMSRDVVIRLPHSSFSADGECAIAVELIGSRMTFVSPRVFVAPGRTVDLRIQNSLSFSTISVW